MNKKLLALSISLLVYVGQAVLPLLENEAFSAASRYRSRSTSRSSKRSSQSGTSSSRHRRKKRHKAAPKTRYAYPIDFFMLKAPDFDRSPYGEDAAFKIRSAFGCGTASIFSPVDLVRASTFAYYPLRGGIFKRREPVKYIIMHSTETIIPLGAKRVIDSWSSGGRRHPGAQFVVDRDGIIYMAVDPELAAVHVNIFKTLPGINNDNAVGIEMVHAGSQVYTNEQRASVVRLVSYLQDRFHVADDHIITHRYAQQGDHTDPVNFDWDGFISIKNNFHYKAIEQMKEVASSTTQEESNISEENDTPQTSVLLDIHRGINNQAGQNNLQLRKEINLEPSVVEQYSRPANAPNVSQDPSKSIIVAPIDSNKNPAK